MTTRSSRDSLSSAQSDLLWLISQGWTHEAIGRELHIHPKSVCNFMAVVERKIGANSSINAVLVGYIGGHIGQYRDCGTRKAYLRHLRREETTCPRCREANRQYVVAQRSQPQPASLTPTHIAIFTAFHKGARTLKEAADMSGVKPDRVGSHVSVVYRRLCIHTLPYADRRRVALEMLRSQGVIV